MKTFILLVVVLLSLKTFAQSKKGNEISFKRAGISLINEETKIDSVMELHSLCNLTLEVLTFRKVGRLIFLKGIVKNPGTYTIDVHSRDTLSKDVLSDASVFKMKTKGEKVILMKTLTTTNEKGEFRVVNILPRTNRRIYLKYFACNIYSIEIKEKTPPNKT